MRFKTTRYRDIKLIFLTSQSQFVDSNTILSHLEKVSRGQAGYRKAKEAIDSVLQIHDTDASSIAC